MTRPGLAEPERRRDVPPSRRRSLLPEISAHQPVANWSGRGRSEGARSRALSPPLDRTDGTPLPCASEAPQPAFEVENLCRGDQHERFASLRRQQRDLMAGRAEVVKRVAPAPLRTVT